LLPFVQSQTVDSIKVDQAGDKIIIHYEILQSNEKQVFRISLSCFLSSGIKLEPKSISGDFGENVIGGKTDYMIVWDVLKDLEELQSAEFSVKAELIKGSLTKNAKKGRAKNKFYVQILRDSPPVLPGIRIGYSGAWGISLSYSGGQIKEINRYVDHGGSDITRRIVNYRKLQIHLFGGFSYAQLRIYGVNEDIRMFFGPNAGLILNIAKLSVSVDYSYFANNSLVTSGNKIDHSKVGFGIGVRF